MEQVKFFFTSKGLREQDVGENDVSLEEEVNQWLKDESDIRVVSRHFAANQFGCYVAIFYSTKA